MRARWVLTVGLTVHLACSPIRGGPETTANGSAAAIQPMRLRYHGEHRGDHPSWIYTAHVSVNAENQGGRAVWRRSYRFETIDPPPDWQYGTIEGTIVLDRDSLAPIEAQSTFGKARHQSRFRPDRIDGIGVAEDGTVSHASVPIHGLVVTDVWAGLDLYLLALPLKQGFRKRVDVLADDDKPLRPFEVSVERIERIRVRAGEFEAFRVRVDPLDGDDRMRSIYHLRASGPGLVVRKEYVVNPRTEGAMKRSTGTEEFESIDAAN